MSSKRYVTAQELAVELECSLSHAYRLVREMNDELKAQGYLTIAGKVPTAYLEDHIYGYNRREVS